MSETLGSREQEGERSDHDQPTTSQNISPDEGDREVTPPPSSRSPPYSPFRRIRSRAIRQPRHRLGTVGHFPASQLTLNMRNESFCACPQQSQTRDLACKCGEEDSWFEWVWDPESMSAACELTDDNLNARFHVNYSSGTASVRGSQLMTDRQHFWELKMTTPVYGTDIMVGVGTENVDLNSCRYNFCSLLGRDGDSWGFSYFGRTQHKGTFNYIEDSRFGQGSIIGVHLDMWHGSLSFYKNRRPLLQTGTIYTGLGNKALYPMISSTAARTGMRLIKSCSFSTSLQFLCCQMLRKIIPSHLDVTKALVLPPGLHAFLTNNLSWLLRPSELETDHQSPHSSRKRTSAMTEYESDEDAEVESEIPTKRTRQDSSDLSQSEETQLED